MNEASLLTIARTLNAHGVTWAIGASVLLYCHGIVDAPHDIDILIPHGQAEKVDTLLRQIGERLPTAENAAYETPFFATYAVEGTEVDIMADFTIRHEGGRYVYPLDPSGFTAIEREGVRLMLTPLADWYVLYQLMPGREARVRQLEAYLRTRGVDTATKARLAAQKLPDAIRQSLLALPNADPSARN